LCETPERLPISRVGLDVLASLREAASRRATEGLTALTLCVDLGLLIKR
jgi:hypothetical protein